MKSCKGIYRNLLGHRDQWDHPAPQPRPEIVQQSHRGIRSREGLIYGSSTSVEELATIPALFSLDPDLLTARPARLSCRFRTRWQTEERFKLSCAQGSQSLLCRVSRLCSAHERSHRQEEANGCKDHAKAQPHQATACASEVCRQELQRSDIARALTSAAEMEGDCEQPSNGFVESRPHSRQKRSSRQ